MLLSSIGKFFNSRWHKRLFVYGLYASYALLLISFTGIFAVSSEYLTTLETIIQYYICLILIGRFNPFVYKPNTFDDKYDRRIAFSAGVFLFLSTSMSVVFKQFITNQYHSISNII